VGVPDWAYCGIPSSGQSEGTVLNDMKNQGISCFGCKNRYKCEDSATLCAEAEAYANQDWVNQDGNEHIVDQMVLEAVVDDTKTLGGWIADMTPSVHWTPKEKSILRLLLSGHTRVEICELLEITEGTYWVHLSNMRKKQQKSIGFIHR